MKFFEWLGKALSEDNGNPSSMRLNVIYAVIILIPCVAFALIYTVIYYKDLLTYVLDAVLLFVGGLFGVKVWQKKNETDTDDKPPTVPPNIPTTPNSP